MFSFKKLFGGSSTTESIPSTSSTDNVAVLDAESSKTQTVGKANGVPVRSSLPTEDPDFREIAEQFIQRLNEQLTEMRKARSERNASALRDLAHWLVGAGGTAGYGQFTRPAREMERLAKQGLLVEADGPFAEINDLMARIEV